MALITLANGNVIDADELMANYNYCVALLTNIGPTQLSNVQLINAIQHGYLGSGTNKYHNNDDIYESLKSYNATVGTYPFHSYHATVPATCTVTIPAGAATHGLMVFMTADLKLTANTNIHLPLNFANGTGTPTDLSATGGGYDPRFELSLTYTGTMTLRLPNMMMIDATTVPTIGGGFVASKATILKIGTAYGDGTASKYQLDVIAF